MSLASLTTAEHVEHAPPPEPMHDASFDLREPLPALLLDGLPAGALARMAHRRAVGLALVRRRRWQWGPP